ncbi:hypothetical protein G9A89_021862 [Geosiphon pyriformis]|nr:hypothetical protein G9A89_021862 [Geosiphon pyriformis]
MIGKSILKPRLLVPNSESVPKSKPTCLPTSDAIISLLVSSISTSDLSAAATSNILTTATNNLSTPTDPNTAPKLTTQQNPKTKNDLTELEISNGSSSTNPHLLVTPEDASTNNPAFTQKQPLTSNIPPATITEDESLATIFPFEFEETAATLLFSGVALEAKPITAMYTDTKVEEQSIKLILDSSSTGSNITRQLMDQLANGATKTPIGKIDNFPFEVNGIVTPIKVLMMEATQYQAFIGNDWLFKGQHICVLVTCGHFKTPPREKLLIELEEEKKKPIWEAYQMSWADEDNKGKGKQKEKLIWETDNLTWTDNDESKPTSSWKWEEDKENKGKGKEEETTQTTTTYNTYTIPQQSTYCRSKLICVNCTCGETLLDEGIWHDIPGHGEMCDVECQYTILISDWVKKGTPIEAAWQRAV